MKKVNRITLVIVVLALLVGCKSITNSSGEKVPPFKGTIVYDVEVIQKFDTTLQKSKKGMFGNQMYLTVFRNGDIQRKYNGTSIEGYDLLYLDVEENTIVEKYNNSDSLFEHSASIQNMSKINDLRVDNNNQKILEYELKELSVAAQENHTSTSVGRYLSLRYWYTDALKVDKTLYTNVNDDLWAYFMSKSDGSLFLKYEIDYFSYKVVYTAKEVLSGKYENSKEKMSDTAPRVER